MTRVARSMHLSTSHAVALTICRMLHPPSNAIHAVKRSRAKRWARILDTVTWPSILRRYLLATRANLPISDADVVSDDALAFSPNQLAVKAALELGTKRWWKLSPELHVRLLCLLCDDMLQGSQLRLEIARRLDAMALLHVRPPLLSRHGQHCSSSLCGWSTNRLVLLGM
jgi:hypothetical protein